MNGNNQFYLMHRNDVVTIIEIDPVNGNITKAASKVRKELLPPGANLSQEDLRRWWSRRAVPAARGMIRRILDKNGIATTQMLLTMNYGLSLSDHYWIRPLDSNETWEQVNLFTNEFKDDLGELQFFQNDNDENPLDLRAATVFYPSASTQGELQKKWVIIDGKRYLIKGNYGDSFQQSANEVIASKLHEQQKKAAYTSYRLCGIQTDRGCVQGCICEDFATIRTEFISAYDVVSSEKKENDISEYEHFIKVCRRNGLEEERVRAFLEYQILSDFIITNTDRHFRNFGVLRDSETLSFIGIAPIFDSGNSMFWNCTLLPLQDTLLDIPVSSFRKKEVDLLRYVTDAHLLDIGKLPSEKDIEEILENANLTEKQILGILTGYKRKIALMEKFQRGEKIWSYKYSG